MESDYAQRDAQNKGKKRRTMRMTKRHGQGKPSPMPRRENDTYNPEAIREAMRAFMKKRDLVLREWAERAGVVAGSAYAFLNIPDPEKPEQADRKPTEAPLISFFVRMAAAEGVTVSQLIGETEALAPRLLDHEAQAELQQLYESLARKQEALARLQKRVEELEQKLKR